MTITEGLEAGCCGGGTNETQGYPPFLVEYPSGSRQGFSIADAVVTELKDFGGEVFVYDTESGGYVPSEIVVDEDAGTVTWVAAPPDDED